MKWSLKLLSRLFLQLNSYFLLPDLFRFATNIINLSYVKLAIYMDPRGFLTSVKHSPE
jgi:hypothetical protein